MTSNALESAVGNGLESGGAITTLFGEASTAGLTGAEYASGVGELKFGYDALTYGGAFAGCAFGLF